MVVHVTAYVLKKNSTTNAQCGLSSSHCLCQSCGRPSAPPTALRSLGISCNVVVKLPRIRFRLAAPRCRVVRAPLAALR
eukprot:3280408-Prymnesium_polylepis.1